MVALTVVDSNVWIFMNLEYAPEHKAAHSKIDERRKQGLHVNPIIVSEVFHKLSGLIGVEGAADRTRKILGSRFVVYEPLSLQIAEEALGIASRHAVRINDAMIAAHALQTRESVMTDNVKDFKRVPGLNIIPIRG